MSNNKYVIVALKDGTVTSVPSTKILASRMTVIEECDDSDALPEMVAYWNRVYNWGKYEPEPLKYHYYNPKRNKHVWTRTPSLRGIRHRKEYKLLNS